jgi:hypothetical protein
MIHIFSASQQRVKGIQSDTARKTSPEIWKTTCWKAMFLLELISVFLRWPDDFSCRKTEGQHG